MKILRNGVEVVMTAGEEAAFVAALPTVAALAKADAIRALAASDAAYIRVIDDLIETLIAKGTIAEADLPAAARDKRAARKALREQLA